MSHPAFRVRAVVLVTLVGSLIACGGGSGSSTSSVNAAAALAAAKQKFDSTAGVHFALSSENATGGDVYLTGGDGDASRPSNFGGTFKVFFHIGVISVKVVSSGGGFYVQLPLSSLPSRLD